NAAGLIATPRGDSRPSGRPTVRGDAAASRARLISSASVNKPQWPDPQMRCLRIYATPDGHSHVGEIDIPVTQRSIFPDAAPFELSAHYPASRLRFTRMPF